MRKLRAIILIYILASIFTLFNINHVAANVPYESYVFNFWEEPIPAPQAYLPADIIDERVLQTVLEKPQDIFVWQDKYLYIVDGNRILCLDESYQIIKIIKQFEKNGKKDTFNNPRGVFVTPAGNIYVADTGNKRVIELTQDGKYKREIKAPTDFSEEKIVFNPIKIAITPLENILVISEDLFEGIVQFDMKGNFIGYMGAPRVEPTLADIFWKTIATKEQRDRLSLFIPTDYRSLSLDEQGFIFAIETENIKRLNPNGEDILKMETIKGDNIELVTANSQIDKSVFVDILGRQDGIYSVLDSTRGRIFSYDQTGNLLYMFGNKGDMEGTFNKPVALEEFNGRLLVLDEIKKNITVFNPTRYAQMIHKAIDLYQDGYYDLSADVWNDVLKLNPNYELAYTHLGRSYFRKGQIKEALPMLRLANNREDYSKAYQYYRKEFIDKHFGQIMFVIGVIIILILLILKTGKKVMAKVSTAAASSDLAVVKKYKESKFKETIKALRYTRYLIFHPFDGYWDLKHEKKGNLYAAMVILILVVLTMIINRQYIGFILNERNLDNLNFYMEAASVIIPFILWCVVNWSLTTLMDGKGTFKDIVIASAYSLTPIILIFIPITVISNFILLEEGAFYYLFQGIALVWFLGLLFFGTMTIHDYNLGKNFLTTILSAVGMALIIFIGLLFFSIIDILRYFIVSIYQEISLR